MMTCARGFARVLGPYMQTIMKRYVYAMRCDHYAVFDELICLWYDMLKTCSGHVMCMTWIVMSESMKTLWYDICASWIIWYDWYAKRQTSMKYNPDMHKRNDKWYDMKKTLAGL